MSPIFRSRQGIASGSTGSIAIAVLCLLTLALLEASPNPKYGPERSGTLREAAAGRHIDVGTAVASAFLKDAQYSDVLGSEFNVLEAENEMKFASIHPRPDTDPSPYDFAGGDALVNFAISHDMLVRGHTLVWHNQISDWVKKRGYTESQLGTILQNHIHAVVNHYASRIFAWDVVNEAFNDDGTMRSTIWYDHPGIGAGRDTKYIEQALRWAHEADPKAKLFYNDYDAEVINKKSDAIYAMAKDFKDRGVPLDGVGFQTHLELKVDTPGNISSYAKNLERFAKLGLELHITELDIRLNNSSAASLSAQAKLYREVATLCVQEKACKLIQTWGFSDKHSWIPGFYKGQGWALLWDAEYRKKPAYEAVRDGLMN